MTVATPEVKKGKKFTAIWIIPIAAVLLGAWMVYHTYSTEGPEIRITFKTADGLEEGKTKIKYRNVEMGMVQKITLGDNLEGVTVVVKMRREALPLLVQDTRFWVVTAEIGGGGITGLETILKGAYIQLAPGESSSKSLDFRGLEDPPLTKVGADGIRLILVDEGASATKSGEPVLYRGFTVGRIESVTFEPLDGKFRHVIFIDAPYDVLVNSSIRFWEASGISISTGAGGLEVDTGSLESIILGGVAFETPPGLEPGGPVEDQTQFTLYPSFNKILEGPYKQRVYYVASFEGSVKGLKAGTPVRYRGIKVGAVKRVLIAELVRAAELDPTIPKGGAIPVLFYLEPARLSLPDTKESLDFLRGVIENGATKGLRATIGGGTLLAGTKVIELDYFPDLPDATYGEFEGYQTIPSTVTGLSGIERKLSALLDKFNGLPLEQTVGSMNLVLTELNQTLKALHEILDNRNLRTVPGELQQTLEALRKILEDEGIREIPEEIKDTLAAAQFQLQGDSPQVYQLGRTLKEVESAARALREFLDLLEVKPESLIRGKSDTSQ